MAAEKYQRLEVHAALNSSDVTAEHCLIGHAPSKTVACPSVSSQEMRLRPSFAGHIC